jgi:hypothetical protein
MVWYGLDLSGSVYRPVGGSCEHSDELSGYINALKFLND